jgi:3-hydroxyisobutyrate dehydrogenase-like beta-hydroxyacid dehydrogenase
VEVVDAPVSGARAGAVSRTLTTMIGGDESVATWCTPVFESWSAHVRYLGPAGSGQLAKLFNNASLSALNQAITLANASHLREVELMDMGLFATAMAERDADAEAVTGRGVSGAEGLVELINRVNPR